MSGSSGGRSSEREHRLWGGRSSSAPAASLDALNRSLPVDRRLWREDVEGSRAWARALAAAGVLASDEAEALDRGLERVAARIEAGAAVDAPDEDIHTLVERLLYEEAGPVAGKLHTGRSRNDQVATDSRLWALRAGTDLRAELRGLQAALVDLAERSVDVVMPAYSHLRRAQPLRAAHWALAHFWALQRDQQRLDQALERTAVMPLGSGAATGCAFPVDRDRLARDLGFRAVSPNSLDAVGDRDWVCELVFVAALTGAHLSRLAEDLILFSSDEFAFLRLPDAFTTGSSLLPQKRNPDGLELARAKAARLAGDVAAALALLKGLPAGYHKDLQEDKDLLFSAIDTLLLLLPPTRETIAGITFDAERCARAASEPALLAIDLADALVRRGVPFREAHGAVGRLLRRADELGRSPAELSDDEWAAAHPRLVEGGRPSLSLTDSLDSRSVPGGTARSAVDDQIRSARLALRSPDPLTELPDPT